MSPGAALPSGSSQRDFTAMWRRQLPWWHTVFAAMLGVVATLVVVGGRPAAGGQLAVLGVIGAAYATVGAKGRGFRDHRWGRVLVVIAWSGLVLDQVLDPGSPAWLLSLMLYPIGWAMLPKREAVLATVVGVGVPGWLRWQAAGGGAEATSDLLVNSTISLAMSLGLGLFITRMIHEAETRAETIDALREAQGRLAAVEREHGVAQERERVSREIHDTLAQGFLSVLSLARAADAALGRGDLGTARERLALLERTAADNLSEARLIVAELTPGHLQSRTLVEALERLVDTVCRESPLEARLVVTGTPEALGATLEVALLRTAQEALANVRRHAGASRVEIAISYEDLAAVRLAVTDDGCGFDPTQTGGGFGLDGIRSRTAQLGGVVMIESVPQLPSGTTVAVEVPR